MLHCGNAADAAAMMMLMLSITLTIIFKMPSLFSSSLLDATIFC